MNYNLIKTMTKNAISQETKQQIAADLRTFIGRRAAGSANKASKMLNGISNGYISLILNNKWEAISDDSWRNLHKQVASVNNSWQMVEIRPYKVLRSVLEDAREYSNTYGIIADAGTGKTFTANEMKEVPNVFVIHCSEYFNRKTFLREILKAMGKDSGGYTVTEMMETIIAEMMKLDNPVIILDEADKLSDQVLYFFISLYNSLEGKCGLVLMATDFLRKRVERGLRLGKRGYREIYSRLGRKFIEIPKPDKVDVSSVCEANGVFDPLVLTKIWNESDGDLRRVERLVHAEMRKGGSNGR